MIKVKGKYNEAIVYTNSLELSAQGIIKAMCDSITCEGSSIRIMPDVHTGKGCCIGTTMTIKDKVVPSFLGVDIGCGLTVCHIDNKKKLELPKLDSIITKNIPCGPSSRKTAITSMEDFDKLYYNKMDKNKLNRGLATLGGGNHFIEVDVDPEDGSYYIIIHSGSRGLGTQLAKYYMDKAYEYCKQELPYYASYISGNLLEQYLHDILIVQKYAKMNRDLMINIILDNMKIKNSRIINVYNIPHNYIDTEYNILRKGAISAKDGEDVIIPLNMRDGCLIGIGKGNADYNYSAPHGAGRLYSRAETANHVTLSMFKKSMQGIYAKVDKSTLDESPMVYKSKEDIISYLDSTVYITKEIKPIYNFKGGRE